MATLAEALDLCSTKDAEAAVVNLILQGETAYAVATILAARNIPFGFASGVDRAHTDDGWKQRPFLPKPYTTADLREFLKQVLPDHIASASKF